MSAANREPNALPLLTHAGTQQPIAYRNGRALSVAQFLADVHGLAAALPDARFVLNGCIDRYRFVVTMAAALLRGQVNVLPHNHVAATLGHVQAQFKGLYCVTDDESLFADLVRFKYPSQHFDPASCAGEVPMIPADQVAACLFTSGSTGDPVAHPRTWAQIVLSARAAAQRLQQAVPGHWAILGTVPPQHSYGFESTVHLALQSGSAFVADRPFFPADILQTLAALPRPVLLVTSPVHLRALLAAAQAPQGVSPGGRQAAAIDLILSATAPLSRELALEVERGFAAPVHEIYGSTESGQVASRRTVEGDLWRPLDGVRMSLQASEPATGADLAVAAARTGGAIGLAVASGPYVPGTIVMSDLIELVEDGRFVLHGRVADMVNIAGKRSSIAFLERQLLAVPGVRDAAFLIYEAPGQATARVMAFAVAPGADSARIMAALRARIESVFLPRPLLLVDGLPRDGNGKLPRQRLEALARGLLGPRHDRGGSGGKGGGSGGGGKGGGKHGGRGPGGASGNDG